MRKNRQTAKYHIKSYIIAGSLAGAISMALALAVPVMAAQQSLASVTGQAQIQPMGDGSGKYMMKSDGFYCLDVNGAGSTQAEIHYFQDYEIDGTVFDGYYYHDTDGKFKACSPHMEHLKGVAVFGDKTWNCLCNNIALFHIFDSDGSIIRVAEHNNRLVNSRSLCSGLRLYPWNQA